MVRRHHCVKFVVPLNLLNLRWEHRPCMSLCLFFSRFKISPSLEHSDMYGIKRLATGNGVSRTKDLLFLHGELYASGLPFIIKDCLTWPCLSLTLHESGCLFCISTLTWSEGSSSLALQLQTAMIHVSQCAGQSLRGRENGRRSWSIFHLRALLDSSGKRCASPESARCHGPHGLAVNSIVSTPPQLIWWLHMSYLHADYTPTCHWREEPRRYTSASTPCWLQLTLTTVPTTGARRPADGIGAVVLSWVLARQSGKTRVWDKLANCKSPNHESARIKLHVVLVLLLGVKYLSKF